VYRTPDERFANLRGYALSPRYEEIDGLRMHYLDEGTAGAGTMLLLHGEPSWSFLYRNVIPTLVADGYRCIALGGPTR
jgi:haloalkane dehalogenase